MLCHESSAGQGAAGAGGTSEPAQVEGIRQAETFILETFAAKIAQERKRGPVVAPIVNNRHACQGSVDSVDGRQAPNSDGALVWPHLGDEFYPLCCKEI